MDRTGRLYAVVEELRAASPRPRSSSWLARRFEVTPRTIERDIATLQQSGQPIWAEPGRSGGYVIDRAHTMPPLALTSDESLAIAVALRSLDTSPFAGAARSAAQKVLASLPDSVRRTEAALAERVHRVGDHPAASGRDVLLSAVSTRAVVHLGYVDASGTATERDIEPHALLWGPDGWYLLAWCRMRTGVRGFLLDRITSSVLLDETFVPREARMAAELARLDSRPALD